MVGRVLTRKDITRRFRVSRALVRRHIEQGNLKPDGVIAGAEVFLDVNVHEWFGSHCEEIRRRQKLAVPGR
jgi:hypothetical protein